MHLRYRRINHSSRILRGLFCALFIACGVLLSQTAVLAAGGDITAQFAGDDRRQEAAAMAVDLSGNVVVTGYQNISGDTNDDFYTVKFKADGSGLAWAANVLDYAGGSDRATAVAIDTSGDIVVTGIVTSGGKQDILTVKYNGATGEELWRAVYNGDASGHDIAVAITVDDRDNIYVGGYTQNLAANDDYLVLTYAKTGPNQDGSPIWVVQYDGTGHGTDRLTGIATGAGSVALTGHSWNGTDFDVATLKYSDTGELTWVQRKSSTGLQPDWGKSVAIDGSGDVVMTGYLTTQVGQDIQKDIYTAKYRNPPAGTTPVLVWEAAYSTSFDDEPVAVLVAGGNVYVAGMTMTLTGNRDMLLLAYRDPISGQTPDTAWTRIINSDGGDIDEAVALTADHSGNLYLTGTRSSVLVNTQTVKVRQSDGIILWHKSYENPTARNNRPVGVGVSAVDDVFVAGFIERAGAFDLDMFSFRYDPGFINPPTSLVSSGLAKQPNGTYNVTLSWQDNATNEESYIIERRIGSGSYQTLQTLGANVTTFTDTNLTEWTHYAYRVKARNTTHGDSLYSNEERVLALVVAPLPPVWSYLYNGRYDSDDIATAIAVGPDQNPVITGYSLDYAPGYQDGTFSTDYLTVKLDRNSAGPGAGAGQGVLWLDQYEGGFNQEDDAKGVAVDSNNRVIVTGNSFQFPGAGDNVNSIVTMKYPAAGPPAIWQGQYNGPVAIDDRVKAIAANSDGSDSIAVIGHGRNAILPNANEDIYIIKYAADPAKDGQGKAIPEWAAQPLDFNGGDDFPSAVVFDKDGNIVVAGYVESAYGTSAYATYVTKFCGKANSLACEGVAAGQPIWSHVRSDIVGDNRARALAVDGNGDVYIAGLVKTTDSNRDFLVAKYDGKKTPAGERLLWSRTYRSPDYLAGDDEAVAIRYDAVDNRVVVAGNSDVAYADSDITIISYSAADGSVRWVKSVPSAGYDEVANELALDFSGNIYVVGSSTGGPMLDTDSLTVKFDYDGNLLGRTIYDQAGNIDEATTAVTNAAGDLFVAGYATNAHTGPNGANADYLVYKVGGVALQVPLPVTVTQHYRSAELTWSDNASTEIGYELERKSGACPVDVRTIDPQNPWVAVTGSPLAANTTSFTDDGLAAGGEYCYRLRAIASNGEVTRWVPRGTVMAEPPPPAAVAATPVDTTSIRLNWSDATTNEHGFFIERCEGVGCTFADTEPGYFSATAPASATTYLDTAVCAGKVYRYRIQAFRTNEWRSAFATVASEVTPVPVAPPTGVTAITLNEAQITVGWTTQTADASGYKLWRCQDAGVPCTDFGVLPVATAAAGTASFLDNTFTPSATFRYKVAAFKQTAACSWTSDLSATSAVATTASTDLTLTASGITTTQANLSWANVASTETGYRLERCVMPACSAPVDFAELITSAPNVTSHMDTTLCAGTTYGYRVKAVNEGLTMNGKGAWSRRIPLTITDFATDKVSRLVLNRQPEMKSDYSDIRFYDEAGKIELPYWVEPFTGQPASVVVWIRLGKNKDVSLYYGNAAASSSGNVAAVFGEAPVGYWPFREAAGTISGTTADISGNGLNANLSGMVASYGIVAGGKYGNALSMAPNGLVYVNDAANSPLDITGSITVELWYQYQKSMDWARVISKRANYGNEPWDLYHIFLDNDPVAQRAIFRVVSNNGLPYQGVQTPASSQLVPGTWYHLVGRYNATTGRISLFVNGVEYANTGTPFAIGTNDEPFGIGTMGSSANRALGMYDEVRLYNKALSDQELSSRYAAKMPTVTAEQAPSAGPFAFGSWSGAYSSPQPVLQVSAAVLPAPTGVTASWMSESQIKVDWSYVNGEQTGFEVDRCLAGICTKVKDAAAQDRSFTDNGLQHNTTYYYQVRAVKAATCPASSANAVSANQETTLKAPAVSAPVADVGTDCADYRLFENDGVTAVPFWVEQCNTSKATIWVKYSSLANGPRSLKLYYGNLAATTGVADPKTIFTFFDGFGGTAIDQDLWTIDNATGWSVANGQLRGTNTSGRLMTKSSFGAGYVTESKAKTTTRAAGGQQMAGFYLWSGSSLGIMDYPGNAHYRTNNSWVTFPSELPLATNLLYHVQKISNATGRVRITNLDTNMQLHDSGEIANSLLLGPVALGKRYDDNSSVLNQPYVADWDWVRVRRYLADSVAPTTSVGGEVAILPSELPGWLARRPITINNPGSALNYVAPDGYQVGIVVDSTPLATDRVTLTWQDTTATEEQFVVERCLGTAATCTAGSFPIDQSRTVASSAGVGVMVSFADTAVAKGTSYCYRVRATRSSGWLATPDSTIVCGQTSAMPAAPQLQSAVGQESRIDLTWTAADTVGENGFEIDRCTIISPATDCDLATQRDSGFPKQAEPNATTFADQGVCGSYKYRVRSFKLGAASWPGWSNELTAATVLPVSPTNVSVTPVNDTQTTVSWKDNTGDESGFEIWRCAGSGCDFSVPTVLWAGAAAGSGATVNFTDSAGLVPGIYRYQVRAIKSGGSCGWPSPFSAPSADVIVAAPAPTGVNATAPNTTQATVAWTDATSSESGFAVQRCKDVAQMTPCTDFLQVGTVAGANVTSYGDSQVCAGSTYRYQVGAINTGIQFTQSGGSCWTSRMQLQISNFQPNFISRLTIPRNAAMKADYSDLRFYDTAVGTELPYWIEQADGSSVTVWFKTGANNAVYLYFGNATATAVSSVTGVFGTSLKAYWPFNEATGTISGTLADASGNSNAVTMANIALPHGVVASGRYGNALSLDGANDIATKAVPAIPTGSVMSVEAWLYPKGYGYDYNGFVSWGSRGCTGYGFGASFGTNGKPQLATWCNDYYSNGSALTLNAWNHVVYVLNGTTVDVYVNGVKSTGTLSASATPNLSSLNLSIGSLEAASGTRHFNGMIDELRIYGQALSSADVASRYAATFPAVTLGAVESSGGCQNVYAGSMSTPAIAVTPKVGNLVNDPDIESGFGSGFKWAGLSGLGYSQTSIDTTTRYSGKGSLKVAPIGSMNGGGQAVPVVPNATYVLSGYLKTNFPTSGIRAQCDVQGTGIDSAGIAISTAGPVDWTYLQESVVIPSGTTTVNVRCFVDGTNPQGAAWFDMVQLVPQQTIALSASRVSEAAIRLDWSDALKDETGFRVSRCAWNGGDTSCTTYGQLGGDLPADQVGFIDVSVEPGRKYSYRVETFKTSACAWPTIVSNEVTVTASLNPPSTPVAEALDTTRARVSWSSDYTSETGFNLLRSMSTDGGQSWSSYSLLAGKAAAAATSFVDDTVCPGSQVRYKVQAFKDGLSGSGGNCWTRVKTVTVTNHQPAIQVRFTVNYDTDMKSDYSDLRFYDQAAATELPYWIESSDATTATVWVKTGSSASMLMYYGNPSAAAASNGNRVFEFFDDFAGTTLNATKWQEVDTASNFVTQNEELIFARNAPDGQAGIYSRSNFPRPFIFEVLGITGNQYGDFRYGMKNTSSSVASDQFIHALFMNWYNTPEMRVVDADAAAAAASGGYITSNVRYRFRIDVLPIGAKYSFGPVAGSMTTFATGTTGYVSPLKIAMATNYRDGRFDNVIVRRHVAVEPTVNIGSEQVLGVCPTFIGQWVSPESGESNAVALPLPQSPLLTSVNSISDSEVAVTWTPQTSDQSGFRILRCEAASASCTPVDVGLTVGAGLSSYTDPGRTPSTSYCYQVAAYKSAACTTGWSAAVSSVLCDLTMVGQATDLLATPLTSRAIRLTWKGNGDAANDEEGFEVETLVSRSMQAAIANDAGMWVQIAKVPKSQVTNDYSFDHSQGLEPNHTYWYRVRPFRGVDKSPFTTPAKVTTFRPSEGPAPDVCPPQ